jgi:UDP-N-acetylmuramate: L-alanyl-gamma-D-glutamyl-meso-diaminopimelate ligase
MNAMIPYRIHFIAIGGAAMHALAIDLKTQGYIVSGSDDEIFEPSRSLLLKHGLLPEAPGWFPEKISDRLDAVILGMHARRDNPELLEALKKEIRVYSYPEFLYERTRNKKRVVIAGSHGKTTITAMVMHVLRFHQVAFDYLVGSRIAGFENMVSLQDDTGVAVFEGDEYLASAMDPRPKFHVYRPHIALISGIAWDHINVFPTYDLYKEQFAVFINQLPADGLLIYYGGDEELKSLVSQSPSLAAGIPYGTHPYSTDEQRTWLKTEKGNIPLEIFGQHNLQNINGARLVCENLGISATHFYEAISGFKGAGKRLQTLARNDETAVFLDFAHSPSKVKATIGAVKEQFHGKKLVACLELHTFSSLSKAFLAHYSMTMKEADEAMVFYDPAVVAHKKLEVFTPQDIVNAFQHKNLRVYTGAHQVKDFLYAHSWKDTVLLMMSSGNFSGIDFQDLADRITGKKY